MRYALMVITLLVAGLYADDALSQNARGGAEIYSGAFIGLAAETPSASSGRGGN